MPHFVDLTHRIENGMTFFPGDPEPRITPAEIAGPWRVTELRLATHTGTHVDAPSHFVPGGKTIDQYPLTRFVLPGLLANVAPQADEPIGPEALAEYWSVLPRDGIRAGQAT